MNERPSLLLVLVLALRLLFAISVNGMHGVLAMEGDVTFSAAAALLTAFSFLTLSIRSCS